MRLFFGSDIIGNQKIFGITVTATDCTYTGDSIIAVGDTAGIVFEADSGYVLPLTVTVSGASYVWDSETGVLVLSNATGAVTVSVVAEAQAPVGEDKIYGVSGLYQSSPALTRTDDSVGMSAVVNSSTGVVSSDFDSAFPWNEATVETINGNKFLHMPDMWFRVGYDGENRITDIAVSKSQGSNGNWYKVDSFYYGCYGGSVSSNKLASVSGVARQHTKTRAEFRTYATANGSGYHQLDLYHHTVMMFLWWIEFANKDSQSIMRGVDNRTARSTGGTDSLTSPSGFNTSTKQMRYHYIEDFVGNYYEFVEGSVGNGTAGSTQYVTADPSKFSDNTSGLNALAFNSPASGNGNCIAAFGWDHNNPFLVLPKEVVNNGSNNTYFCDYGSTSNNVVCYCGAYWSNSGADVGVSCFVRGLSAYSSSSVGGRLLYKP